APPAPLALAAPGALGPLAAAGAWAAAFGGGEGFEGAWGAGALIPEVVWEEGGPGPQWWRAWSAPLAHAGGRHLLGNALALALVARVARARHGWGWRAGLFAYCAAALVALARAAIGGGWSVGLSGGVFALLGATAAAAWGGGARLTGLVAPLALALLFGWAGSGAGADGVSHALGFGLGALCGALWAHPRAPRGARALRALTLSAALSAAVGLAAAARALRAPGGPRGGWARVSHVRELDGPALTNGLCAVGPLRLNPAASPLWRAALSAPPRPLRGAPPLTLRAALVTEGAAAGRASVGLVWGAGAGGGGSGAPLGAVCLTPAVARGGDPAGLAAAARLWEERGAGR
ncbi:MAG: rhomboid family intramembrane serine protease, partial [Deltaproteobacteria bacterium]|nr:rhomboid family intramembrane serine protease [Deltaproteobacteria bacterium]